MEALPSYKLRLEWLATNVASEFSFPPYTENGPRIGRSSLSYQLQNLQDRGQRDCKLPTFMMASCLRDLGIPCKLTTWGLSAHPRVLVPWIKQGLSTNLDHVLSVSFNIDGPTVDLRRAFGSLMQWGQLDDTEFVKKLRMHFYTVDQSGIHEIDLLYQKVVDIYNQSETNAEV